MPKLVFIDESGDLGLSSQSSSHLIITALIVSDPLPLNRIIKKLRRNSSFKKELKDCSEIKGNKASKALKKYVFSMLNEIENLRVIHIVFEKQKLTDAYLSKDKHKLYNCIAGKIAEYVTSENCDLVIRIDRSKGKQALIDDFNKSLEHKFETVGFCHNLQIHHSNSNAWAGLQLVDVLAWAEFQKICRGNNEYICLLNSDKQEEHDVFER
jgi:hypothetical protein